MSGRGGLARAVALAFAVAVPLAACGRSGTDTAATAPSSSSSSPTKALSGAAGAPAASSSEPAPAASSSDVPASASSSSAPAASSSAPLTQCKVDADCVPKTCCHATECTLRTKAPKCEGKKCTKKKDDLSFDWGGKCGCVDGVCQSFLLRVPRSLRDPPKNPF